MNWLDLIILPLIQGVAEFLPISSSGHLVIVEAVSGQRPNATYNILLHGGTLASILIFYHRRIWDLLKQDRRVLPLLVVGTIPAAILGITIKFTFEEVLETPWLAAILLPITGMTLPLVSYGGTSFIACMMALALLVSVSQHRPFLLADKPFEEPVDPSIRVPIWPEDRQRSRLPSGG